MLYITASTCISSQQSFPQVNLDSFIASVDNKVSVIEPSYDGIPEKILRRMGKAVRMGVGAAVPLIKKDGNPDGIIIGTANGGMEDCIRFLNQIIEYDEGMLTPTNFVQSTANAIAGQIALLSKNKGYNITHVHKGHAFENALLDAMMYLREHNEHRLLVGAVDEISAYNYNIDNLAGWFKKTETTSGVLYGSDSPGSLAGEGSAMFLVAATGAKDSVKVNDLVTVTSSEPAVISDSLQKFIVKNDLKANPPNLYFSGENGDSRMAPFYNTCEGLFHDVPVVRFKHISGEYSTASAIAVWLACYVLNSGTVPQHMWKNNPAAIKPSKILIYNNHKGLQHSFILCSAGS